MRLLWTVANWKRTGPVEPSLDLAAALDRRGHEVLVVTGRPVGSAPDEAGEAAEARGLQRLRLGLALRKHVGFLANRRDARGVAAHLRARTPDAVVVTLRNDHRIVARALAQAGLGVPLVRTWFEDGAEAPGDEEATLLRAAAAVVVFGAGPAATLQRAGVAPERVVVLAPPLDVDRVRRGATDVAAARAGFLAPPGALVVGLVARVQPHRRFDLLWDALALLRDRGASVFAVVVGRGTSFHDVAREPVARRRLEDRVRFAGYLRGSAYASALAAFDAQLLLVPGSDPTVRALREGMALGVPSVVTRLGLLPDLVEHGRTGLVVDDAPAALADALARLAADPQARAAMGVAAAARAETSFALGRVAERLEAALAAAAQRATAR
ncbi:MAG: glycosyltransferase family 4 protein [Planctomycetes bacterium]|nr:glycosyltransferase family 4 protein [Planctomycetota bacterium]